MIIAPLRIAGLAEAAAFVNDCWRAAYAEILDRAFLDGLTTQGRREILARKLDSGLSGEVARDDDGAMLGIVLHGPTHLRLLGDAGEINMLYVRPDRIGTGLGHALFAGAERALCGQGYTTLGLDVFSANAPAIAFYVAHGYRRVGGKVDVIDGREYELDIMAKRVETS